MEFRKQFEGKSKVTALDRVDLTVERGEMVAIVGQSLLHGRGAHQGDAPKQDTDLVSDFL